MPTHIYMKLTLKIKMKVVSKKLNYFLFFKHLTELFKVEEKINIHH